MFTIFGCIVNWARIHSFYICFCLLSIDCLYILRNEKWHWIIFWKWMGERDDVEQRIEEKKTKLNWRFFVQSNFQYRWRRAPWRRDKKNARKFLNNLVIIRTTLEPLAVLYSFRLHCFFPKKRTSETPSNQWNALFIFRFILAASAKHQFIQNETFIWQRGKKKHEDEKVALLII